MTNRMSAADRQAWQSARSLADLGELTARWLEGSITSLPGYKPGSGPDPETAPLVPVLAGLNRAAYLTVTSQPGEAGPGYDGAWWNQRAAVQGFAGALTAGRVAVAAVSAGLTVITCAPGEAPRWRDRYDRAEPVTVRADAACSWLGVRLSRRSLADTWTGYGICGRPAVGALSAAWQLTVLDPEWGRDDLLWPVLTAALAVSARTGGAS